MISLELDAGDLNRLVRAARTITNVSALKKIDDFRLIGGNTLSFSQSFTDIPVIGRKTNVQIGFSCDESGSLLIEIVSLADSKFGNFWIQQAINGYLLTSGENGGLAGFIANKSRGWLVRKSDKVLSFDPEPMKVRSVSVCAGTLSVKADVF